MTRRNIPQIIFVASVALAATAVPHAIFAATTLNFSGKFVHRASKADSDLDPEITLEVAQTDQAVEITRDGPAGKTTNQYLLDGSEQECVTSTHLSAKCKAQLKGKSLLLESIVESSNQATGAVVHIHTVEQWQLSGDSKTLIIKVRVDYPGTNAGADGEVVEQEKYVRESQ